MVFLNHTTMQMTAKIVYYGPGLCGKTTNLHHVHRRTDPGSRGEMVSLETEADRTLFFDLLPLDAGVIGGMRVRLQLYTVPGQVFYNATRKLVLKGVDGIVFVADSQSAAREANEESLRNLRENLAELDTPLDQVPLVFQYNKRDLRSIDPVEHLNRLLNPSSSPYYEAAALHGIGVFETLKAISRLTLAAIRKKAAVDLHRISLPTPVPASVMLQAPPIAPPLTSANPLAELVDEAAPEVHVEFAVKGSSSGPLREVDIQEELESLRMLTSTPQPSPSPVEPDGEGLEELLTGTLPGHEMERRASVEVPAHLVPGVSAVKVHLSFAANGHEELLKDALTVPLAEPRPDRLTLRLELDLKKKRTGQP